VNPKILSQAGDSLADIYDVKGSIAGIENLESRDLPIVHEMGATVFSERFSTEILRISSAAQSQSDDWGTLLTGLPDTVFRVQGVRVFVDVTARVTLASLAMRDPVTARETPIWSWDDANDGETSVRFSDDGAATGVSIFLQPAPGNVQLPKIGAGDQQPQRVNGLIFRGTTPAFGAGTVEAVALVDIAFAQIGGVSSRGLPIPGW